MRYVERPGIATPPGDTRLVRYLDLLRFVDLLRTSSLYLPSLRELRLSHDGWEGALSDRRLEEIAAFASRLDQTRSARFIASTIDDYAKRPDVTHVCCFNMQAHDMISFWERYAPAGVAFFTTVDRLGEALLDEGTVCLAEVGYSDYSTDEMQHGPYVPAARKRTSFRDEQEARLIVVDRVAQPPVRLRVNLDVLIEEVVVSPRLDGWAVDNVRHLMRLAGLDPGLAVHSPIARPLREVEDLLVASADEPGEPDIDR